ncbi:MAG: OmpA family protein [Lachnospiraceae bacterium]|nr:OmpA family protein [Lachnospiraceae bacterium]
MKKRLFTIGLCVILVMGTFGCGTGKNNNAGRTDSDPVEHDDSSSDQKESASTGNGADTDALSDVFHYPGEDERILFGTYELEDWYMSRFSDKSDAEKEELFNKYQSELHFSDVEIYSSIFEEYETHRLSVEPIQISFGYAQAGGTIFGTTYPFLEPDLYSDSEITDFCPYSVNHKSDILLKAADKVLYETVDESEAAVIAQNLRKLCDSGLMEITYAQENDKNSLSLLYLYKVDGSEILYTPFSVNYLTLELNVPSESEWERMPFGFRGTSLVVAKDGKEIELGSSNQVYRNAIDDGYFYIKGYADDEMYQDIAEILVSFDNGENHSEGYVTFADDSITRATADLIEDNKVTIQWTGADQPREEPEMADNAGSVTFEFVAASNDGFALYDGNKIYYYYSEEESYYSDILSDNLEEGTDITDLDDEEIETLEDNRTVVVSALREGFSIAGINADVDEETGKVIMDNSFLFAVDSDELSPEGLQYLDSFMEVYAEVIKKQSDDGKVGCVKVIGHTDISGSYEYNLDLSERRAAAVVTYCTENYPELASLITSEGKSFSEPIYNEDGSVNMDASRRVEFKAILLY